MYLEGRMYNYRYIVLNMTYAEVIIPISFTVVPPNSFGILSTGEVFSNNHTIVEPGSSVVLTLQFVADILPIVTWFRAGLSNDIGTMLSNNSMYSISGPVKTEMENIFRVSL